MLIIRDDAIDPFDNVALSLVVPKTTVVVKRSTSFTIQPIKSVDSKIKRRLGKIYTADSEQRTKGLYLPKLPSVSVSLSMLLT